MRRTGDDALAARMGDPVGRLAVDELDASASGGRERRRTVSEVISLLPSVASEINAQLRSPYVRIYGVSRSKTTSVHPAVPAADAEVPRGRMPGHAAHAETAIRSRRWAECGQLTSVDRVDVERDVDGRFGHGDVASARRPENVGSIGRRESKVLRQSDSSSSVRRTRTRSNDSTSYRPSRSLPAWRSNSAK